MTVGAALAGQRFANTASVASDTFDPEPTNNSDSATVAVDPACPTSPA